MAKVHHALTRGLSGKIGNTLIFRRVGNETIVSAAPTEPRKWSSVQKKHQNRFRQAATYASMQMNDPVIKAAYALSVKGAPTRTAYHVALTDFLNPPEITGLTYEGTGNVISIFAMDDFRVTRVRISIYSLHNELIGKGDAVQQASGLEWRYAPAGLLSGMHIKASAFDLAGNETVREMVFEPQSAS